MPAPSGMVDSCIALQPCSASPFKACRCQCSTTAGSKPWVYSRDTPDDTTTMSRSGRVCAGAVAHGPDKPVLAGPCFQTVPNPRYLLTVRDDTRANQATPRQLVLIAAGPATMIL